MSIASYRDLTVWKKSIDLIVEIYRLTEKFPRSELFSLTSQMRRAAVSIASNIAEGRSRSSRKDYRRFLYNAFGSGAELETHIIIAKKLRLGETEVFLAADGLLEEVMKMLNVLITKLA